MAYCKYNLATTSDPIWKDGVIVGLAITGHYVQEDIWFRTGSHGDDWDYDQVKVSPVFTSRDDAAIFMEGLADGGV